MEKPLIRPVLKALTIDYNIKDMYGKETLTIKDMHMLLTNYEGYTDGDRRKIVIWGKK